jgi:hypothetical protein
LPGTPSRETIGAYSNEADTMSTAQLLFSQAAPPAPIGPGTVDSAAFDASNQALVLAAFFVGAIVGACTAQLIGVDAFGNKYPLTAAVPLVAGAQSFSAGLRQIGQTGVLPVLAAPAAYLGHSATPMFENLAVRLVVPAAGSLSTSIDVRGAS